MNINDFTVFIYEVNQIQPDQAIENVHIIIPCLF